MKRTLSIFLTALMICIMICPAFAAESAAILYPENIVEYMEGDHPRLNKIYTLAASDDPALIPSSDFERDGKIYTLLDMTRQDNIQINTRAYIETVTLSSKTKNMEKIIAMLEASMEVATEDGYTGTLTLDTENIKVETAGYGSSSRTITATRSYPNLSDADTSLVPKTIEDNGRTLTLTDVQWQEAGGYYHATANYTGTATSRYVTSVPGAEKSAKELSSPSAGVNWLPVIPVVICLVGLAALGLYLTKKHKAKKSWEGYGK